MNSKTAKASSGVQTANSDECAGSGCPVAASRSALYRPRLLGHRIEAYAARKNALFAGSSEGAENWAMLASLIETCKLNSVNPEAYFTDVLTKLVNSWPNRRPAELLPWAWTADTR